MAGGFIKASLTNLHCCVEKSAHLVIQWYSTY